MRPQEEKKFARQLHQNLAKEECDVCKRLFSEHSPEEFKAHALDDVTIELDIATEELRHPPRLRALELRLRQIDIDQRIALSFKRLRSISRGCNYCALGNSSRIGAPGDPAQVRLTGYRNR